MQLKRGVCFRVYNRVRIRLQGISLLISIHASTDRLAIPHMDTLHADQAFNNAAERHMLMTIKLAATVDNRRFELVCPCDADDAEAVHVLSEDLTAVQYVLIDPATRFASYSCPVAAQHKPCKHQVAWLLSLAPAERKTDAERLVLSRLGTLLGFASGCSMESISELSVALKNLLPVAPDLSVSDPVAAAAPPSPEPATTVPVTSASALAAAATARSAATVTFTAAVAPVVHSRASWL
jgi:hypothetical protein